VLKTLLGIEGRIQIREPHLPFKVKASQDRQRVPENYLSVRLAGSISVSRAFFQRLGPEPGIGGVKQNRGAIRIEGHAALLVAPNESCKREL
jgi:hypothetical protein